MITFIIQAKESNGYTIPAQSYGYTLIEAIEYNEWYHGEKVYDYVLDNSPYFESYTEFDMFDSSCIPIGSVEYVLKWLKLKGVDNIKPLNVPQKLTKYIKRNYDSLFTGRYLSGDSNTFYVKSQDRIKDEMNGEVTKDILYSNKDKYRYTFVTEMLDNVVSEWRIFVWKGKILGCKCYSGDEFKYPDMKYIKTIIDNYDKDCYTLDVMVDTSITDEGITDILELHDFFAVGLYGFEDFQHLPLMYINCIRNLLKKEE